MIDMDRLGERTLLIDCDVIQADADGRPPSLELGSPWTRPAGHSCSKACWSNRPWSIRWRPFRSGWLMARPCWIYSEDSRAEVDLNVVQASDSRLLEIQGTAEGAPFSRSQFNELLDLAEPGLTSLMQAQRQALKEHSSVT